MAVEDEPDGAPGFDPRESSRENRVVGEDGSGSNRNGWKEATPFHDIRMGLLAGDPAGGAGTGGDASVERGSAFGDQEGCLFPDPVIENEIEVCAGVFEHPGGDIHSVVSEDGNRLAVVQGIGVEGADDDAANARCEDNVRAWRRSSVG